MQQIIDRGAYALTLSEPTLYVDNKARGRSGHMTHALAEFAPGKLIDFNSNCSAKRHGGHATFGWVEYRISEDGGETYSPTRPLPYAYQSFIDGLQVISVEKAVACDDGSIVAVCLQNDPVSVCQPWNVPMIVRSCDGGETWTDAVPMCDYKGRCYDACYHDGVIYVLEFCNEGTGHFCGHEPDHLYRIFASEDNGLSFYELCVLPIPYLGRGYGSMVFDADDRLHVYAYNVHDEVQMDHVISPDRGKTWGEPEQCYLTYGIRNPQVNIIDGVYVAHGRSKDLNGFVLYSSLDGSKWDEGAYIGTGHGACYYSNNIVLRDPEGKNRLLIQYSESYEGSCVNIMHRWLRVVR